MSCFVIPWDGCLGLCYGLTDTKAATAWPWHLSVAYASIMSLCLGGLNVLWSYDSLLP